MFDKLAAELGASRRLRLGLALIVAVLWLYGVLLLRDARDERTRGFRQASVQLVKITLSSTTRLGSRSWMRSAVARGTTS